MSNEATEPKATVIRRARNLKGREEELQALAAEQAEERLRNGDATAAEILYFLKKSSIKERLELENLEMQNKLLKARTAAIESERDSVQAYHDAMKAFAGYLPSQDD